MTERDPLEIELGCAVDGLLNPSRARRRAAELLPRSAAAFVAASPGAARRTELLQHLLHEVWPRLLAERGWRWDLGWAELVGGFAAAVELIAQEFPSDLESTIRGTPAEAHWFRIRAPFERYILLVDTGAQARRLFVTGPRIDGMPMERAVAWGPKEPAFRDRSHTLLLALLADGALPSNMSPIAATGELHPDGETVLPVLGLVEKAAKWWRAHPDGLLVTGPLGDNAEEEWKALATSTAKNDLGVPRRWILGASCCEIAAKLRALDEDDSPSISATRMELTPRGGDWPDLVGDPLLDAAWATYRQATTGTSACGMLVVGDAGGGKTTLSRRLEREFVAGSLGALGFGVRVSANAVAQCLAGKRTPPWSDILALQEPARRALFLALERTRRLVPIVDGLDEVAEGARADVTAFLRSGSGWWFATTRPVEWAQAALGSPRELVINDLSREQARGMLVALSRHDLAARIEEEGLPPDLTRTPLGIELLANAAVPQVDGSGTAPTSFQTALGFLVSQAQVTGRLSQRDAELLVRLGRYALGELAYWWLVSPNDPVEESEVNRVIDAAGLQAPEREEAKRALVRLGHCLVPSEGGWSFTSRTLAEWAAQDAGKRREAAEAGGRRAVAEACQAIRLLGFPDPGTHACHDDLFVPLALYDREHGELMSLEALSMSLRQGGFSGLVLGAPGAGKTTLLRHLAREMALDPKGPLPFWVPLRQAVQGNGGLLGWLTDANNPLGTSRDQIEDALRAGRALFVLDGLDEIGPPSRRADITDELAVLKAKWPHASYLVSSRPQGVQEVGLQGFDLIDIEPLDPATRMGLLERWCRLLHPRSPEMAREALAAISAAISRDPHVDALATLPLVVAMLALAWRADGRLPKERWAIFDRCIEMMLFSWPAARGKHFDELGDDRQLAALARMAWDLHESADGPWLDVPRRRLEEAASRALSDVVGNAMPRGLAHRWINHLVDGAGLLVDASEGRLEFVHWAIGEALAANGLWEKAGPGSGRLVASWPPRDGSEITRLLMEKRKDDPAFCSSLLDGAVASLEDHPRAVSHRDADEFLSGTADRLPPAAELLVDGVRAGVRWSGAQEQKIFAALATAQRRMHGRIDADREVGDNTGRRYALNDLSGFRTHLDTLRRDRPDVAERWADWLVKTVSAARGEALLDAVVWASTMEPSIAVVDLLDKRTDVAAAAGECVGLWPAGSLGLVQLQEDNADEARGGSTALVPGGVTTRRWVGRHVAADRALAWLDEEPDANLFDLACAALSSGAGDGLAAALAVRVAENALRLGCIEPCSAEALHAMAGGSTSGPHDFIEPRAGDPLIMVYPRRPPFETTRSGVAGGSSWHLHDLVAHLDPELGRWPGLFLVQPPPKALPESLGSRDPAALPQEELERFVAAADQSHTIEFRTIEMLAMSPSGSFDTEELRPPGSSLRPRGASLSRRRGVSLEPPTQARDYEFPLARLRRNGCRPLASFHQFKAIFLGEMLVAACAGNGIPEPDRLGAYRHRMRSRLALEAWPLVDMLARVGDINPNRPGRVALYLTLAWSQHTTTGHWPDTKLLVPCFRFVPDHWLVKAQWHLAWLAHAPDLALHLRGFRDALAAGLSDPLLRPVAERMSSWRFSG